MDVSEIFFCGQCDVKKIGTLIAEGSDSLLLTIIHFFYSL